MNNTLDLITAAMQSIVTQFLYDYEGQVGNGVIVAYLCRRLYMGSTYNDACKPGHKLKKTFIKIRVPL